MKNFQLPYSLRDDYTRQPSLTHRDSSDCWCHPECQLPCFVCLGSANGCGACNRGWRIVEAEEFESSEQPGVCVHRRVENQPPGTSPRGNP